MLQTTGGHPYATQELCYFLWQLTPEGEAADLARLQAALDGVLRSESAHFATVWDHASAQQRLLLQALAAEPGRALTTDYRRRHDLPSPSTVQSAVTALERQELVRQRARRRADRRALPLGVGPRALRRALGAPGVSRRRRRRRRGGSRSGSPRS